MKLKVLLFAAFMGSISILTFAQNAPITTIGDYTTLETNITVSITVENFDNIAAFNLELAYDETIMVAIDVTKGSELWGNFAYNIDDPGTISLSWYTIPGISLTDETEIFSIEFNQFSAGTSPITWINDGNACSYMDGDLIILNDLPSDDYYKNGSVTFSVPIAPITVLPEIEVCEGNSTIDIPVTVQAFNNIGAFNLTLQYANTTIVYQSYTNNSGFPELEVSEPNPGTIYIEGISDEPEGITFNDNTILTTLHFSILDGSTDLTWIDNGESCQYLGSSPSYNILIDEPEFDHYINGSFTELQWPYNAGSISGPDGGLVCTGETDVIFSVSPIPNAETYEWSLPNGANITSGEGTSEIEVSFGQNAVSGEASVFGVNACGEGNLSPIFIVTVEEPPAISVQPVSPDTVYAGNGIATFSVIAEGSNLSYQWQEYNTDWADVTDGGVYSGTQNSMLTITNPQISMNGYKYRCIVSSNCEPPATSDGNAFLIVVLNTGMNDDYMLFNSANDPLQFESFPNPFSNQLSFAYALPSKGIVHIEISNIYGEKILSLANPVESKGDRKLPIDVTNFRSGIYVATIKFIGDNKILTSKIKIITNSNQP